MTLEEAFAKNSDIAKQGRAFVEASAKFLEVLAANNIEIDLGPADKKEGKIDYDAPVLDSYKKTYKPISSSEIIQANKKMAEFLAGEKWFEGFVAMAKLVALAAPL